MVLYLNFIDHLLLPSGTLKAKEQQKQGCWICICCTCEIIVPSSTNALETKKWNWILCLESIDCPKGAPEKEINLGKTEANFNSVRKPSWNKIVWHSLAYSCDTWCPPKIVEDFKNLCPSNGKYPHLMMKLRKNLPQVHWAEMQQKCNIQIPSKKLSNPAQCPMRYRKSLKTFIGRSRAGCSGRQETSSCTAVLA